MTEMKSWEDLGHGLEEHLQLMVEWRKLRGIDQ